MDLDFRSAQPRDAAKAVPLIYASGPPTFDYVFADDGKCSAQEFLRFAFSRRAGEFGCDTHTIVTDNGRIVGVGSCYSGERSFAFMVTALRQILLFYGPLRGLRVVKRGLQVERLIKPPKKMTGCIAHLAVRPERRGEGIGGRLLNHLLAAARHAGHNRVVLDVSAENPRAQALYERCGFSTVHECVSDLPGVPDFRRMQLEL